MGANICRADDVEFFTDPGVLFAAQGDQTVTLGLQPVSGGVGIFPPSLFGLVSRGALGVRWRGQVLRVTIDLSRTVDDPSKLLYTFQVPAKLCGPGVVEWVLYDIEASRPLPYSGWLPIVIPTRAQLFEADIPGDRLVAAGPATGLAYDLLVQNGGYQIQVFRISTGELRDSLSLPGPQKALCFSSDAHYAWIALDANNSQFARLNLDTRAMDQQISITRPGGSSNVSCKPYPADPQILLISFGAGVYGQTPARETDAYADGRRVAEMQGGVSFDDRGRVVYGYGYFGQFHACQLTAAAGLTNCEDLAASGAFIGQNRAAGGSGVYDIRTGQLLVSFQNACNESAAFLPATSRFMACGSLYDGVSLESLGPLLRNGMPLGSPAGDSYPPATPVQLRAPDWLLAYTFEPLAGPNSGILVTEHPQLRPAPSFAAADVVNAATGSAVSLAAGEVVSVFGRNLGPDTPSGPLPEDGLLLSTQVEETQVLFDGVPSAILYASAAQINTVVPDTVNPGGSVSVQVTRYGIPSARVPLATAAFSPGLFTYSLAGKSYAAAQRPDGAVEGPGAPLSRGSVGVFWATGLGLPAGAASDSVGTRPAKLTSSPVLTLGGIPARILYAGSTAGATVGLTQLNVEIPAGCPAGIVEAVLTIGGTRQGGVSVVVE